MTIKCSSDSTLCALPMCSYTVWMCAVLCTQNYWQSICSSLHRAEPFSAANNLCQVAVVWDALTGTDGNCIGTTTSGCITQPQPSTLCVESTCLTSDGYSLVLLFFVCTTQCCVVKYCCGCVGICHAVWSEPLASCVCCPENESNEVKVLMFAYVWTRFQNLFSGSDHLLGWLGLFVRSDCVVGYE